MKRINKISPCIVAVAILLISTESCNTDNRGTINKKLNEIASNLNKDTPVMLDAHTQFDSVSVSTDNILRYHYTVKDIEDPSKLMQEMKDGLDLSLRGAFATNPQLQIFKKYELTIEYIYCDELGQCVETITITPDMYM